MAAHDSALVDIRPRLPGALEAEPDGSDAVDVGGCQPGTVIDVHTKYSRYRLVVVDQDEGRARVTGGSPFPEPTDVWIEGATAGGSAIKAGWIEPGLRLALSDGSRRVTTSTVQAISIDVPKPRRVC